VLTIIPQCSTLYGILFQYVELNYLSFLVNVFNSSLLFSHWRLICHMLVFLTVFFMSILTLTLLTPFKRFLFYHRSPFSSLPFPPLSVFLFLCLSSSLLLSLHPFCMTLYLSIYLSIHQLSITHLPT